MRALLLVLLVACGSSSTPSSTTARPPEDPEPAENTCEGAATKQVLTPDDCACVNGRVNASIGGGEQEHCAAGEEELAPVRMGIEGGWCCVPATTGQ